MICFVVYTVAALAVLLQVLLEATRGSPKVLL